MAWNPWFNEAQFEAHSVVCAMIEQCRAGQASIYDRYRINTQYYLDKTIIGFAPGEFNPDEMNRSYMNLFLTSDDSEDLRNAEEMSWNLIKANVDAVIAQTCSTAPDIRMLPNAAVRAVTQKIDKLEKYTRGVKQKCGANKLARAASKDAAICGIGLLKFSVQNDELAIDKIHPDYITIPENLSLQGKPSWMAQHSWMSPDALHSFISEFGGKRTKKVLEELDLNMHLDNTLNTELIKVYEIWLLPAVGRSGRHIICSTGVTVVDEEWDSNFFPFAKRSWEDQVLGQHGCSHIDGLIPIQNELNFMIQKKARHMAIVSHAYVTMKLGDHTTKEKLQDFPEFSIFESTNPGDLKFDIPPGDHPSWNAYIKDLWQKAFELKGSDPAAAQGRKEAGLSSGIAIRLAADIQSQRYSEYVDGWNQFHKDIVGMIIKISKKYSGKLKSKFRNDQFIETIKWSDVNIADDEFDITIDAANPLSRTTSGRIDNLIELSQSVKMPPELMLGMIKNPDIDKYLNRMAAPRNAVNSFFEKCLDKKEAMDIPKFFDLNVVMEIGTQIYSELLDAGAEEDEILVVLTVLEDAFQQMAPPENEAPMPPDMPPMPPPGDMPPMPPDMPPMPPDMPDMPPMPPGDMGPMPPPEGMPPMPPGDMGPMPPMPPGPEDISSDERVKEKVADGGEGIRNVLDSIEAKEYNYVPGVEDSGAQRHLGVMAQDLEKTPMGSSAVGEGQNGVKYLKAGETAATALAAASDLNKRLKNVESQELADFSKTNPKRMSGIEVKNVIDEALQGGSARPIVNQVADTPAQRYINAKIAEQDAQRAAEGKIVLQSLNNQSEGQKLALTKDQLLASVQNSIDNVLKDEEE